MVAGAYESLTWRRDGMELGSDSVNFTDFRQTLTISSTSSVHAGEYTAEVSASATITFQVWEFSELQLASYLLYNVCTVCMYLCTLIK